MFSRRFLMIALAAPAALGAQTLDQQAAYGAVIGTPLGALTPLMTSTIAGGVQSGVELGVRYGWQAKVVSATSSTTFELRDVRANNFGVSAIMPLGLGATLSATAGAWYPSCTGCDRHLMLSVGADTRIGSVALGPTPASPLFILGVNGELGWGNPSQGSLLAASVGVPLSLVQQGEGMRIVPYVIPALTFGSQYTSGGGGTYSSTRPAIGGGVGLYNSASTLVVSFGFQYVALQQAQATYGLNVQIGGK